ncbi:MAG: TIGR02587 family membrane protein [Acidimicrobiales bacterium]
MPAAAAEDVRARPWSGELVDAVRAASGGMLFGIPLLYTVEVWSIGTLTKPVTMLAVLSFAFLVVLVLSRTEGFRTAHAVGWRDAARDAVEALAIALICVTAVVFLLREVTGTTPLAVALGKVVYEVVPFCIGIGLAHHFLRRGRAEEDTEEEGKNDADGLDATIADIAATVIGAVFIAFNIAPTDEIPLLFSAMGPGQLLAIVAAPLVVTYCIVFEAGFSNEEQRRSQPGILQHPVTETVASYLIALATSGMMLWFFQRARFDDPWPVTLGHVVVLGLPASVGARPDAWPYDDPPARPARNRAERVTFAVSCLLLSVVVALIVVQLFGASTPPRPDVRRNGPVRMQGGQFFVPSRWPTPATAPPPRSRSWPPSRPGARWWPPTR